LGYFGAILSFDVIFSLYLVIRFIKR